jgi:hypothetical protein
MSASTGCECCCRTAQADISIPDWPESLSLGETGKQCEIGGTRNLVTIRQELIRSAVQSIAHAKSRNQKPSFTTLIEINFAVIRSE